VHHKFHASFQDNDPEILLLSFNKLLNDAN
jgi:hypothetical protein